MFLSIFIHFMFIYFIYNLLIAIWISFPSTALNIGLSIGIVVAYLIGLRAFYRHVPTKEFMKHVGLNIGNIILFFGGTFLIYIELLYFETGGNYAAYTVEEMAQFLTEKRWVVFIYQVGFLVVLSNSYRQYFYEKYLEKKQRELKNQGSTTKLEIGKLPEDTKGIEGRKVDSHEGDDNHDTK